jgi:hypothetical protein
MLLETAEWRPPPRIREAAVPGRRGPQIHAADHGHVPHRPVEAPFLE